MSTDHIQLFKKILADNNHSVTKAREATFRLLLSDKPQTMGQIIAAGGNTVDRVSIYRNIALFEELGIVNRLQIGWKYKLEVSDLFHAHHHHMTCLGCGKIIDIEDDASVENFIQNVAANADFWPRQHQFEIIGYCNVCRRQQI